MRRWFCCTHFDTPYLENENGFTSSPDGTSGASVVSDVYLCYFIILQQIRNLECKFQPVLEITGHNCGIAP